MYITITAQKLGGSYSPSSAGFVDYLGKENQGVEQDDMAVSYTHLTLPTKRIV